MTPRVFALLTSTLGLYLTRRILTSQGGYVKLSSRPGQGSVFSLYLPRE